MIITAQAADAAQEGMSYGLLEVFEKGGPLMWGLLFLSIVALMVFILCLGTTRKKAVMPDMIVETTKSYLRRRAYPDLLEKFRGRSSFENTVYAIISFIQHSPNTGLDAIREVAAAEGSRQADELTRRISWLADIGAIAPMVGLLGTVLGMMDTFWEMAHGNFEGVKQMQMASGISEAMITTAGGLMLAIPCMLAYVYFRNRVRKHITNMEAGVTHIVAYLAAQADNDRRLGLAAQIKGMRSEMMDHDDESSLRV